MSFLAHLSRSEYERRVYRNEQPEKPQAKASGCPFFSFIFFGQAKKMNPPAGAGAC